MLPPPNLGIAGFLQRLEDLLAERDYPGARVDWKVNSAGSLVLAIIIPPTYPGQWDDAMKPRGGRPRKGGRG